VGRAESRKEQPGMQAEQRQNAHQEAAAGRAWGRSLPKEVQIPGEAQYSRDHRAVIVCSASLGETHPTPPPGSGEGIYQLFLPSLPIPY